MSEYEYIEFRAVDRPLTDEELAFAEKQSSRAKISRSCFSSEYHYSSFRGDVDGMLRRGYDIYLEYTNYGTRIIKIRLPYGLPFAKKLSSKYIDGEQLKWKRDSEGEAGILTLEPFYEELEETWEFEDCLDAVASIRQQLIGGDLRALYVLWLCVAGDDNCDPTETVEPPVPLGLSDFDFGVAGLFHFFEVDPLLITAASDNPALAESRSQNEATTPTVPSPADRLKPWLQSLKINQATVYLEQFLIGDAAAVKAEILAGIAKQRASSSPGDWPTVELNRTFEELMSCTQKLREEFQAQLKKKNAAKAKRDAAKAERARKKRLADMTKDPQKWLAESERLVDARGIENYKLAAEILADLRDAIGGKEGESLARKHAAHLSHKHPTLTKLKGSLRKLGVLS